MSNYVSGLSSGGNFNLLISGGADYASSGVMIKNDVSAAGSGNKGLAIVHTSSDNSEINFRTQKDSGKTLSVRLQSDADPSQYANLLVVSDDNLSSSSAYGAQVGGRIKASQFHSDAADTRAPITSGVYLGHDTQNKAYLKVNKGLGYGGFSFHTHNSDGSLSKTHMELSSYGYMTLPEYKSSGDQLDTEATAIAAFDSTGKLVRNYNQNARFRSIETRVSNAEDKSQVVIPIRVNEVVRRMNSLEYFSVPMSELISNSNSGLYTVSAQEVQLGLTVSLSTAQSTQWQTSFIESISETFSIPTSSISVVSVSSSPSLTVVASKPIKQTTSSTASLYIIVKILPSSSVDPSSVASRIKDYAMDPNSPFSVKLNSKLGSNPLNTDYVPRTRDVPVSEPTPVPTTPAPTNPPQVTVKNYNDTDSIRNVNNQLFFIWTAPVNCTINSVKVYASGATNNGGYILAKVFIGSNWTQVFSSAYTINSVQDKTLPVADFSQKTVTAGQPFVVQWTTLETYRTFQTRQNATNDLAVTLVYTPL